MVDIQCRQHVSWLGKVSQKKTRERPEKIAYNILKGLSFPEWFLFIFYKLVGLTEVLTKEMIHSILVLGIIILVRMKDKLEWAEIAGVKIILKVIAKDDVASENRMGVKVEEKKLQITLKKKHLHQTAH